MFLPPIAAVAAFLALAAAGAAHAQTADAWPARPVQIIVAGSAGSGTDLMSRAMAQRLAAVFGQQFIVDNRPGASGAIAGAAVAKSPADGHTLLYTNGSFAVMAPALIRTLPYDIQRDLVPVAQTAVGGVLLLVNPEFPAKNLRELVEHVRANPDRYSYGSWAVGSSGHLIMEWLKQQTGMRMNHVAYQAVPRLLTELASGVLPIAWADPSAPLPFLRSGKVRGIAISGNVRVPGTPDIATMGEQGYAFDAVGWFGVFAPAGTPANVVRRLNEEINRIQSTAEMQSLMARMNFEPPPVKSPAQFRDIVASDLQTWKKIVTDNNIRAE
ncbi:MAG: tripartite tricarboxylate transporter substrate binding protein [Burkholderiales bacterium]|nr:tripartite tricarboxylate transporter substrate binding protein [Burkholderiales bacterium]